MTERRALVAKDKDDVSEDGYDPGDDDSDDEAERFIIGADDPIDDK